MTDAQFNPTWPILLTGILVAVAMLLKDALGRKGIPALVGYLAVGFALRLVDVNVHLFSQPAYEIFEFLAKLGILTLLFRIGLDSNIRGLLHQLRSASLIWVVNVLASAACGYGAAYYGLGLPRLPSVFVAIALTATSVGISVGVWEDAGAVTSPHGELLVDVAELDDLSSITLMALLFAIVPVLQHVNPGTTLLPVILQAGGEILLKLLAFGALCLLFSLYLEKPIVSFFHKIQTPPEPMLMVVSLGFIIGALAGLLGFSVAIGAFFAGLVFSRDPDAVKEVASFNAIYELFSPFFFIGIGLSMKPEAFGTGLKFGGVLLCAAVLGKMFGVILPARLSTEWQGATLLGISMIPRAEVAMIVMQQGLEQQHSGVSPQLYAGMVLVSAVTCLVSPIIIRALLRKWPQTNQGENPS